MGVFEDIGKTNTLRAVTSDISRMAVNMKQIDNRKAVADRELDLRDRRVAVVEANAELARKTEIDKQKKANEFSLVSSFRKNFLTQEAYEKSINDGTKAGVIETRDGVLIIENNKIPTMFGVMQDDRKGYNAVNVQALQGQLTQIETQIGQAKNEKELNKLREAYTVTEKKLHGVINAGEMADRVDEKIKAGYSLENVGKWAKSGDIRDLGELSVDDSEKRIIKAADGYNYYEGTKERVLPDVKIEEDTEYTPGKALDEITAIRKSIATFEKSSEMTMMLSGLLANLGQDVPEGTKVSEEDKKAYIAAAEKQIKYLEQFGPVEYNRIVVSKTDPTKRMGEVADGKGGWRWVDIK